MPVIDIMLSCKTQIKTSQTRRRQNPKIHCYLSIIQRYITDIMIRNILKCTKQLKNNIHILNIIISKPITLKSKYIPS